MASDTAKFTRIKEDFICGHCSAEIKGNGYTNHCPKCLYSRHVDNNPGDRANSCKSLMKAVFLLKKGSNLSIIHECTRCRVLKVNKVQEGDDLELVFKLPITNRVP